MVTKPYKEKGPDDEPDHSQVRKIQNRKLALVWLRKSGWRISQASLYRHIRAGKLPMAPSGTIAVDDLKIYAAAYLQPAEQPPDCRVVSAVHEQERAARIALLEARKRKLDLEHGVAAGRYVERDQVLLEFCSKLGLIDSVFKTGIRSRVAEWLIELDADPEKGPALFSLFETEIDRLMDDMANMDTIRVRVRRDPEAAAK